jgi:hypothetical protein
VVAVVGEVEKEVVTAAAVDEDLEDLVRTF